MKPSSPRGAWIREILLVVAIAVTCPFAVHAQPSPPFYHARGMDSWDFWYVHDANRYYTFYDQVQAGEPQRIEHAVIGMATSPDLAHWSEVGEVLGPGPPGSWDEISVVTGSTWRWQGRWMMLYTGHGAGGSHAIGLATSDDLVHWTKSVANPLALRTFHFRVPASGYWQGKGFPADTILDCSVVADPYVLPTAIGGWSYMVMDCIIDNIPAEEGGSVGLFRSQDGIHWEFRTLIAAPRLYAQLEVPQVWNHDGRWYLIFGGANVSPYATTTVVYSAASLDGPFLPTPRPTVVLPDDTPWFYVAKVVTDPRGQDVLLANTSKAVTNPFPVVYEADGSLTLLPYDPAASGWLPGGLAGVTGAVVSDGVGGVISNGAARVNANGIVAWRAQQGVTGSTWTSDGRGGALGTWLSSSAIYGSHTLGNGGQPWGSSLLVCRPGAFISSPVVVRGGAGDAIFAWTDNRGGSGLDVFAQHVDSLGQLNWTLNGTRLCGATGIQSDPVIVSDGVGGAIVAWGDSRSGSAAGTDIYAQRVDGAGVVRWGANGAVVSSAVGAQVAPAIAADGSGGVYVAWWDARSGSNDIYMQHLSVAGTRLWAPDGIPIATGLRDQLRAVLVGDAGGVFVAWEDHRSDSPEGSDIYAQRVSPAGISLWPLDGVAVCSELSAQKSPSGVADGSGGLIVAWMDGRNAPSSAQYTYEPYVQRLSANGAPQWTPDGVRVAFGPGTLSPPPPSIATDGTGGVFVDGVNGLQRMLRDGKGAWVPKYEPVIESVADVAADEGGFVRVTINAPLADISGLSPPIAMYQLSRRIPNASEWEGVGFIAATRQSSYLAVAPTRSDSGSTGPADDVFRVSAVTIGPSLVIDGASRPGHSVDNLAPGPPEGLIGVAVSSDTVRLVWNARGESDFWHYNVYRGGSASFPLSAATLVGQPTDAAWDDTANPTAGADFYKVTSVDRHGNESAPALLPPSRIGPTPSNVIPRSTFLGRVSPNPVSASARIDYGAAREGRIELSVFDLAGRRVRWLVNGTVKAGVWQSQWDAKDDGGRSLRAGVYWVRMVADGFHGSRRVVVAE